MPGQQSRSALPGILRQELARVAGKEFVQQIEAQGWDNDILFSLLEHLAHANLATSLSTDACNALIHEYEEEGARLQQLLDFTGLRPDILPEASTNACQVVAESASQLGLAQATPGAMAAAWSLLVCEDQAMGDTEAQLTQQLKALKHDSQWTADAYQETHRALAASSANIRAKAKQAEMDTKPKTEDYKLRTKRYQKQTEAGAEQLARTGWTQAISHHQLVQQSQALDSKKEQLTELKTQLAEYMDLPASQLGAELRLKQAQDQLAVISTRVEKGMNIR